MLFPFFCVGDVMSTAWPGADHEGVEAVFGDLPAQIWIVAKGDELVIEAPEVGIRGLGGRRPGNALAAAPMPAPCRN
jgi:hypothetical protein